MHASLGSLQLAEMVHAAFTRTAMHWAAFHDLPQGLWKIGVQGCKP